MRRKTRQQGNAAVIFPGGPTLGNAAADPPSHHQITITSTTCPLAGAKAAKHIASAGHRFKAPKESPASQAKLLMAVVC